MSDTFDPDDDRTWPIPASAVVMWEPLRVDLYGKGWLDGFEKALEMADNFHQTGQWT